MKKTSINFKGLFNTNWANITAIVLLCGLVVALPIFIAGFPRGGDDQDQHLRFSMTYFNALVSGDLFPGWADDNLGFGSVGVRLYPPLVYIPTAFAKWITGNWYDAFTLNLIAWMCLGCIGVYLFCKEWVPPLPAMFGGVLYAIIPYHLTQIYQYFLYAEFAALAILPFCFLYLTRAILRGQWLDVFLFAASCSLLVLTHIPLSIIAAIALVIYGAVLLEWKSIGRTIMQLSVAALAILAATSFYWIRIVEENHWVAHDEAAYTSGNYDFSVWLFPNLLQVRQLYINTLASWLFDTTIIVTALLVVPAVIYLVLKRKQDRYNAKVLIALLATAAFSFFMLSRASFLVWTYVPVLQKLQFPWRWLCSLSFECVVLFVMGLSFLIREYPGRSRALIYPAIVLILAISVYDITQSVLPGTPETRSAFDTRTADLSEPTAKYWWPVWAKDGAFENREKVTAAGRSVHISKWRSETREFAVSEGEPLNLRVATFYYPYWNATVNDKPVAVDKDESGAITVPVNGEASRVRIYFEEPFIYKITQWLSLLTWASLLIFFGSYFIRRFFRS